MDGEGGGEAGILTRSREEAKTREGRKRGEDDGLFVGIVLRVFLAEHPLAELAADEPVLHA